MQIISWAGRQAETILKTTAKLYKGSRSLWIYSARGDLISTTREKLHPWCLVLRKALPSCWPPPPWTRGTGQQSTSQETLRWPAQPAPAHQVGGWQLFMGPYALQSVTCGHYAWIILSACFQSISSSLFATIPQMEKLRDRETKSLHFTSLLIQQVRYIYQFQCFFGENPCGKNCPTNI